MKHITTVMILMTLMLFAPSLGLMKPLWAEATDDSTQSFRDAKKLIYEKKWHEAMKIFSNISRDFPDSKWADDSLYWEAYCLNKISQSNGGSNQQRALEFKKKAIAKAAGLIKHYPDSKWVDDARRLTVEMAEELVQKGFKEYKKYIIKSAAEEDNIEIKLTALHALAQMDNETAFPRLEKLIRHNKNKELRKKALWVLTQIDDPRVLELLVSTAETDPDIEIRQSAIFWLGNMGGPEPLKHLLNIYAKATNVELKKKILLAIGRQDGEDGANILIGIYKKEKDIEIKKSIIFWLGNNKSKTAKKFILEILED